MTSKKCNLGMIGLGVMGQNLVLNMAEHGYSVAGYNKNLEKVQALKDAAGELNICGAVDYPSFVASLQTPRIIMLLVPAGSAVDSVIQALLPLLEPGDTIIDGGNSHFTDTDAREKALADKGLSFFGVGVSGGEQGARFGPSIMPGGPREAYERVKPIFEAVAAKVDSEPCVKYLGPRSAGHYVKMVHNGIEYGLIQLIAESYDLMTRGLGLTSDELHAVFAEWNAHELQSFLIEITAEVFLRKDDKTGKPLVDVILDEAKQKGTGKWTSQDAMEMQVPVPTIDAAVSARDLSAYKSEREAATKLLTGPATKVSSDRQALIDHLRKAFYAAMVITYAQGMAQLTKASAVHEYDLNLRDVATIWRGGCIIRASVLEDIRATYALTPDLTNILLGHLGKEVEDRQADLRTIVETFVKSGIPAPAFMASLAYFDGYRSARLPANLIQAQRDFFGAHTYERIDEVGVFHTEWEQK